MYTVIKDTREQDGWFFTIDKTCLGVVNKALKTGDYTIEGYEDILTIERKGCVSEFAGNVTQDRFIRELERMQTFKYRYVILEFSLDQLLAYPNGCGIPAAKIRFMRVTGRYILAKLIEFSIKYNVHFIFAGRNGKDYASSIFKRVIEAETVGEENAD